MNVFARTADIYRRTRKDDDFFWARYPSRPFAALFLALFHRWRLTPNFYTVVSLFVGLASCAAFAFADGYAGLWLAYGLCQLAYIVDCMDGMQARYEKLASPVGVSFDFLVDEIKQMFLFPAVAWRLYVETGASATTLGAWPGVQIGSEVWLWCAVLSGPLVAAGLAMTTFMRAPAYTGTATQAIRSQRGGGLIGRVLKAVSFLMNYPSWILIPVIFNRMDVFLAISVPLYALYALYAFAQLTRKIVPMRHYGMVPPETPSPQDDAPAVGPAQ